MSFPKGYKCVPSEESTCEVTQPEGKPAGYKKRKRDEHSPPRMAAGPVKVCQVCYRKTHGHMGTACDRCLKDWNDLAKLEKEIAAVFPATIKLTTPQIFRRLWERSTKQAAAIKKLKAQLLTLKLARQESAQDLIGGRG